MIKKAIEFILIKHEGQTRKVSGLPYFTHPIIVSCLLSKYKQSKHIEDLIVASLLHDTLEDTNTDFIELATLFTPLVASLVLELTNDKNEINRVGKTDYLKVKMCGISSYGLTIKLIDRLSNIQDNPTQKYIDSTKEILLYIY